MTSPLGQAWMKDHPLWPQKITDAYRGKLAIMQGLTNQSSAQFIVLTEADRQYGYIVLNSAGSALPVEITLRETRKHSKWGIEKLYVQNLKINESYRLQVIDPGTGKVADERIFTSLNTHASKGSFVLASCMKDSKEELREVMWDSVALSNPDLVFLVGDTCYADNDLPSKDEAGYWQRYCETRNLLSHFRQRRLIPTLATWDDHDFGGNNYDSSFPMKDTLKEMFHLFWGHEVSEGLSRGPGVSQVFAAFGQRFFLMDCRSFRSPRNKVTMPMQWGRIQEDFLYGELSSSKDPAWILNGSQVFGGYLKKDAFEYWQGENLKEVCRELAKVEAPIGFASGDVHFSEFMNIEPEILGYKTFEITSSSIHSTTFPGQHLREKNKRRIDATSANNFVWIEAENRGAEGWAVQAKCYGRNLRHHFTHNYTVKR